MNYLPNFFAVLRCNLLILMSFIQGTGGLVNFILTSGACLSITEGFNLFRVPNSSVCIKMTYTGVCFEFLKFCNMSADVVVNCPLFVHR